MKDLIQLMMFLALKLWSKNQQRHGRVMFLMSDGLFATNSFDFLLSIYPSPFISASTIVCKNTNHNDMHLCLEGQVKFEQLFIIENFETLSTMDLTSSLESIISYSLITANTYFFNFQCNRKFTKWLKIDLQILNTHTIIIL